MLICYALLVAANIAYSKFKAVKTQLIIRRMKLWISERVLDEIKLSFLEKLSHLTFSTLR